MSAAAVRLLMLTVLLWRIAQPVVIASANLYFVFSPSDFVSTQAAYIGIGGEFPFD
jgi:hypothetical protein